MFSPVLWQGQKDLSRLPPRVLLPGGERSAPTEAGAETGAWTQPTGLQAPTTRTAQGAAAPRCQILPHTNEKSQVPHKRYLTFLAGAEGLVSPAGSVSSRQSATGARSPLGTRFWSGCGNTQAREGKERYWAVLPKKPKTGGAGLVLSREKPSPKHPEKQENHKI